MAAAYYDLFDNQTNGGKVFSIDLSALDDLPVNRLTQAEVDERNNWRATMKTVFGHYFSVVSPQVTTTECLLQQRVMVPNLASTAVSSRSQFKEARRGRRYPPAIFTWDGFAQSVEAFTPAPIGVQPQVSDIFRLSMFDSSPQIDLSDEKEEEAYILGVLRKSLMTAGLIGKIATRGGLGKPDAITLPNREVAMALPSDIGLIVEFKSTHNLPMPMTADRVAEVYNTAYEEVINQRMGRTAGWSRVCHPIGQLLGYMVENGRRYGVLSSATRAYFVSIKGDGVQAKVCISAPWFVGEPNFLRAWAFMHSLAIQQQQPLSASTLTWQKTGSDQPTPSPKRKRGGLRSDTIAEGVSNAESKDETGNEEKRSDAPAGSTSQMSRLKEIPFESIDIIGTIGYGRNGVVFLADWHGEKVALKQFDVGKGGYESFDKEVAAYIALEPVWGTLVATPLFLSESWSGLVKFIGLQLGRDPLPGDDLSERTRVLSTLENEHGFRHGDAEDSGNMIFVLDQKTNTERLVAIDLESHTMIRPTPT